jgi:hypothetical protein
MKSEQQRRKSTRSQAWADTKATIKFENPLAPTRDVEKITGRVKDIGATGMFFTTRESVPMFTKVSIKIDFDPSSSSSASQLTADGEIIREAKDGVGIRFISIDLERLGKCILARMKKP